MTREPEIDPPAVEPRAAEAVAKLLAHYGVTLPEAQRASVLSKAGARAWGTAAVRAFSDRGGPGWLVDLSGSLGGKEIYAVVRSVGPGQRSIVDAVMADDAEKMLGGSVAGDQIEQSGDTVDGGADDAPVPARREPVPDPNAPALVVYPGEPGKRVPAHEVAAIVQSLIREGVDPSQVEVWTNVKRPKISVVLS